MAISQNPITGRMRQKMSNVVFSTVFSQNVVRSKPLTVRNPKTAKQTKHCLLYTSDAADDLLCVDLGGRRII